MKRGIFLYSDGDSLYIHEDEPAPGYVTLSYEPDEARPRLDRGDALILPRSVFLALCNLCSDYKPLTLQA